MKMSALAVAAALLVWGSGMVPAQATVWRPLDGKDAAMADGPYADTNFGDDPRLNMDLGAGVRSIGLIEFELTDYPYPALHPRATLVLRHSANLCPKCRLDFYRVTSPWDEATVTFNTAPSYDPVPLSSWTILNFGYNSIGDGYGVYVTEAVVGWRRGLFPNHGFWVEVTPLVGTTPMVFASSDDPGPWWWKPELVLYYEAPEPGSLALLGLGLVGLGVARRRRVGAVVGGVVLSALSLGYTAPSGATPLTNIDGIGTTTGFILWIPGEGPGVYSMKHDAAAGQSTYLQQGTWDYTPWFDSEGPPVFAGFEGIFAWTAGIGPDGRVTDPGSMLFIGDLGAGDEVLMGGQLHRVGVMSQGPSEWDDSTLFYGLQYLFTLTFLDPRLSGLGNAVRFDFPTIVESGYDSPFHEDFELGSDSLWSDPGLIGLKVPEPGPLGLVGIGLAGLVGLGVARRRRAGEH